MLIRPSRRCYWLLVPDRRRRSTRGRWLRRAVAGIRAIGAGSRRIDCRQSARLGRGNHTSFPGRRRFLSEVSNTGRRVKLLSSLSGSSRISPPFSAESLALKRGGSWMPRACSAAWICLESTGKGMGLFRVVDEMLSRIGYKRHATFQVVIICGKAT